MLATERRAALLAALDERGRIRVSRAAAELAVSEETVRRDLDLLAGKGLVRRVHGGAIPVDALRALESPLAERLAEHRDAKERIAERALAMLPAEGSVILDAGSTTLTLAERLAQDAASADPSVRGRNLVVITNSIAAAAVLAGCPGVTVEVLGGTLRGVTHAVAGSQADARLATIRADVAILGANGVSSSHGLSTPDAVEADTKTAMVGATRERLVLADATKHESAHLHRFAELDAIDVLLTDQAPPAALAAALHDAGAEVVVA